MTLRGRREPGLVRQPAGTPDIDDLAEQDWRCLRRLKPMLDTGVHADPGDVVRWQELTAAERVLAVVAVVLFGVYAWLVLGTERGDLATIALVGSIGTMWFLLYRRRQQR